MAQPNHPGGNSQLISSHLYNQSLYSAFLSSILLQTDNQVILDIRGNPQTRKVQSKANKQQYGGAKTIQGEDYLKEIINNPNEIGKHYNHKTRIGYH